MDSGTNKYKLYDGSNILPTLLSEDTFVFYELIPLYIEFFPKLAFTLPLFTCVISNEDVFFFCNTDTYC